MPNYNDIIHLPHHVSKKRPQMPLSQRASIFAPFSALTGYEDQIKETDRITTRKIELTEEEKEILNRKLQMIQTCGKKNPNVKITYFVPDEKKSGGAYRTVIGRIKKMDEHLKEIILTSRQKISINDMLDVMIVESN